MKCLSVPVDEHLRPVIINANQIMAFNLLLPMQAGGITKPKTTHPQGFQFSFPQIRVLIQNSRKATAPFLKFLKRERSTSGSQKNTCKSWGFSLAFITSICSAQFSAAMM